MSTVVDIATPQELFEQYDSNMEAARPIAKDFFLEFLGTFAFVYISLAGVNQTVLSGSNSQLEVAICFAVGLTTGIYIAGKSGGHLNPAVSVTVYFTKHDFSLWRMFGYIVSQVLGAFAAALLVIAVYYGWINNYSDEQMVGSFGTLKNPGNSLFGSILDQFIGSAILMFGITSIPDIKCKPMIIGMILGALALFQGSNGFAFNLARDFGPRAASAIVFGKTPFSSMDYWFWVPMVVPFFGVPFGWVIAKLRTQLE